MQDVDALDGFKKRAAATVTAVVASYRGDGKATPPDMLMALEGTLLEAQSKGGDRVEVPSDGWKGA